jgi:hypothetical protein
MPANYERSSNIASLTSERAFRHRRPVAPVATSHKAWLGRSKSKSERWARWVVLAGLAVSVLSFIALTALAYVTSNRANYMDVLNGVSDPEDWERILKGSSYEGSFDQYVDDNEVSWHTDSMLFIRPKWIEAASAPSLDPRTNATVQQPHVDTAKLRSIASITFGKAHVTAKFPGGDWIWSTISLEAVANTYGAFPGSGRIDLAQIRGNGRGFVSGGIDEADHILHYGAAGVVASDCAYKDRYSSKLGMTDFSSSFHTFGVEWTPNFIRLWLDIPSNTVLYSAYPRGFWRKTGFSLYRGGDPRLLYSDPWTNGTRAAPFDVAFKLVIRVNIGAVGGIFADVDEKPWYDAAGRNEAMLNFNQQNQTWLPTWGEADQHTLQVKAVHMSQELAADSTWKS